MKDKKLLYLLTVLIILVSLNFYVITSLSKTNNFFVHKVKNLMAQSSRDFLKKVNKKVKNIFFVFNNNKILKSKIEDRNIKIFDILDSIKAFDFTRDSEEIINNKYKLTKYTNFLLNEMGPRSYLSLDNDMFVLMTGTGTLMYANINNFKKRNIVFRKIESNFNQLAMLKLTNGRKIVVKNILIDDNKIYVPYLKLVNEKCAKLAVLSSKMDLNELNFIEF